MTVVPEEYRRRVAALYTPRAAIGNTHPAGGGGMTLDELRAATAQMTADVNQIRATRKAQQKPSAAGHLTAAEQQLYNQFWPAG